MSNIKLIVTDLDGTMAQLGAHEASEHVREAVIACENQSVRIVPVTGRTLDMARPLLLVLGIEGPGVFDNGASVQDIKSGTVLWSRWLSAAKLREVASLIVEYAIRINYESSYDDEHVPADNELDRITAATTEASIFALVRTDDVPELSNQLQEIGDITYYFAPDSEGRDGHMGVQVTREGADKFHGVQALREILNISKEQTLAIGDGANDLPLFANASVRIAMGNATDTLKAEADHIVAPVEHDGWADAMEHFVLDAPLPKQRV
jgi:HAD superfamily hydrolase (TIGR01484 family)